MCIYSQKDGTFGGKGLWLPRRDKNKGGGRQGTAVSLRRRSNEPELLIYREAGAGIRSAVWAPQGVRIHATAVDGTKWCQLNAVTLVWRLLTWLLGTGS